LTVNIFQDDTPDGSLMGMTTAMISHTPFSNYMIPGLFLLIIHGIGNIIGAMFSFNLIDAAGKTGVLLGLILNLWIIIQMYWMGYTSFLQPLMLSFGIVEAGIGIIIIRRLRKIRGVKQ
jgi:hypothetical protein